MLSLNESMESSMRAFVDAMKLPSLRQLWMLHAPAPSGIRARVPKDVELWIDEPRP